MNKTLIVLTALCISHLNPGYSQEANAFFTDCTDCPQMVVIPAGSFQMGSASAAGSAGEFEELPRHTVSIKAFSLGRYEVTQTEWQAIMEHNPSVHQGAMLPVENISWDEAQEFVHKLSKKTGKQYRLPTEAEWEFAARAGSSTLYSFGDEESGLDQYAWTEKNAGGTSHPVGMKKPNALGLFDMHGNVWERIEDCWHIDYEDAPQDGSAWVSGDCSRRIVRGGSWINLPQFHRSAYRFRYSPSSRYEFIGLRVARTN
ncbi:MAG: formylglycine-generating enzyme family protein [Burkholderiaceae bacterium]